MALSVPVNGLKEGDKEPVIELFVKVRRCCGGCVSARAVPVPFGPVSAPRPDRWSPPPPAAVFPPAPSRGPSQVSLSGSLRAAGRCRTEEGGSRGRSRFQHPPAPLTAAAQRCG